MTDVADAGMRERALSPTRSFIVGAPAGSGKTTLLTQRFLRLLATVDEPESIVAITFTRKAAEEMLDRILRALRGARSGASDLDPVTRLWAQAALAANDANDWRLLDSPRRLRVQTIDALSATLARRGPLMSGYAGDVAIVENADAYYSEAARAALTELGRPTSVWSAPVKTLLRHLDNDWARLEGLLAVMLSRRDQWLRLIVAAPERAIFETALARVVSDELAECVLNLPRHCHGEVVQLAAYAGANMQLDNPDDRRVELAGIDALPPAEVDNLVPWQAIADLFLTQNGTWRKRVNKTDGFPPGATAASFKARHAALVEEFAALPDLLAGMHALRTLPRPIYQQWEWDGIEALFAVLKLAAAHLKISFDLGGAVDFAEVAQAALAALGGEQEPSDLQLLLDYQIRHLLIDEFQDTSISQFELVERLIDGWTDDDGRTLFVVGDPMQSIYRFRQAEVHLFINTAKLGRIGSVSLDRLQLTTNFRAQAHLIEWLNGAIEAIGEDRSCPFTRLPRLIASRPAGAAPAVFMHGLCGTDGAGEASTVVEIVKLAQREDREQSIGILVRSRNHLGAISAELAAAGIEVSASEIDRLDAQAIVQDLVALTRALLHPADRTAWLALLRAPWCGLSLAAFARLFEPERDMPIWDRLQQLTADDALLPADAAVLGGCYDAIARAVPDVGRVPIAMLVERTWLDLCGPRIYPAPALRQAERYFELLAAHTRQTSLVTPRGLAELLGRYYVAPPPHAHASVEIMTIHGAKGLEFDCVIVPGLNRKPRSDPRRILEWRHYLGADGNRLVFAPITRTGDADAAIFEYLRSAEKKDGDDEAYRLLYVALTRARESLHLIATTKSMDDGSPAAAAARSFLAMLWPALADRMTFGETGGTAVPGAAAPLERPVQQLKRLVWTRTRVPSLPRDAGASVLIPGGPKVEFSWAGALAKHIGTIVHALLQQVCTDGLSHWDARRAQTLGPAIESRLRSVGVADEAISAAVGKIIGALTRVLESDRGRWALSDQHENAASEFSLAAVIDGFPVNAIIDRTFIDAGATRWIIDFKTGEHGGGARDAFIASEVERYRPQLERYARLMRRHDDRAIRLGLFFPLLDDWVEWAFEEHDGTGEEVH